MTQYEKFMLQTDTLQRLVGAGTATAATATVNILSAATRALHVSGTLLVGTSVTLTIQKVRWPLSEGFCSFWVAS